MSTLQVTTFQMDGKTTHVLMTTAQQRQWRVRIALLQAEMDLLVMDANGMEERFFGSFAEQLRDLANKFQTRFELQRVSVSATGAVPCSVGNGSEGN